MKKRILSISAVLAAMLFAAVLFVSCDNAISPASFNDKNVKAERATTGGGFDVFVTDPGSLVNTTEQEFRIDFTLNTQLTAEIIKNGVTIYNLSNSTSTYTRGSQIPFDVVTVSESYAILRADLSSVNDTLEVFADPAKLIARNGAKMNLDYDDLYGEAGDDDYYDYLTVGQAPGKTEPARVFAGTERRPRAGLYIYPQVFVDTYTLTNFFGETPTGSRFTDAYVIRIDTDYDHEDFTSKLNNALRIEKYNPSSKSWENVRYTGVYTPDDGQADNPAREGYYVATFNTPAASDAEVYRARFENIQSLVTDREYYGFKQRYTMDNRERGEILIGPIRAASSDPEYVSTLLSVTDQYYIFYPYNTTVIADSSGKNVQIKIELDSDAIARTGDLGFNKATLEDAKNFMVYYGNVFIPITSAKQYDDSDGYAQYIILKLDPSYKMADYPYLAYFDLFVSPNLKTAGDKDQTSDNPDPVKPKSFGDPSALNVPPEYKTWYRASYLGLI